jgi:hypothetical protein
MTEPLRHSAQISARPETSSSERGPELVKAEVVFVEFARAKLAPRRRARIKEERRKVSEKGFHEFQMMQNSALQSV